MPTTTIDLLWICLGNRPKEVGRNDQHVRCSGYARRMGEGSEILGRSARYAHRPTVETDVARRVAPVHQCTQGGDVACRLAPPDSRRARVSRRKTAVQQGQARHHWLVGLQRALEHRVLRAPRTSSITSASNSSITSASNSSITT